MPSGCFWLAAARGRLRLYRVGRVPSRGGLPESWCAVAHFPFSSPLSSLRLYVYLPFYMQYDTHIKRLQHNSQNILTRKPFPLWSCVCMARENLGTTQTELLSNPAS
jgi:hypothetical protein